MLVGNEEVLVLIEEVLEVLGTCGLLGGSCVHCEGSVCAVGVSMGF